MVSPANPATILFGRTRQAILSLMFTRPDESFYFREIVRRTGCGVGAVQRELTQLTSCGLLRREKDKYFQTNSDSPIYQPLQDIIIRTIGVADGLRRAIASVADQIAAAFIFGSFVRGEQRAESDVDVMIITRTESLKSEDVARLLRPEQQRLAREINPFILSVREFRAKSLARNHFIRSIIAGEKVFLIGDDGELKRLAEERLAKKASDKSAGNRRTARIGRTRPQRRQNKGAK